MVDIIVFYKNLVRKIKRVFKDKQRLKRLFCWI